MKNTCELIGYYGSDETVALSAWTSTSRELTDEKRARIPQLLKQLWKAGHETPFEKINFHFLVNTDIATHIHLLKHRISSLNAESARYKELTEDKMYIPGDFIIQLSEEARSQVPFSYGLTWDKVLEVYTSQGNSLYHLALVDLEKTLGRKRAKESARYFKTYNSQISADVQFNGRSFMNFIKLRMNDHAQLEVADLAYQMLTAIRTIEGSPFDHTLAAWFSDEN